MGYGHLWLLRNYLMEEVRLLMRLPLALYCQHPNLLLGEQLIAATKSTLPLWMNRQAWGMLASLSDHRQLTLQTWGWSNTAPGEQPNGFGAHGWVGG